MNLSPLTESATAPQTYVPRSGRPVVGKPRNIEIDFGGLTGKGLTTAQKQGLRYEAKAQLHLQEQLSGYCPSPVFEFFDDTGFRKCVPDGLYLPMNSEWPIVVFEIKLQHMPEAWFQLRKLYQPVVQARFERRRVAVVEVCKSYDPAMTFPEPVNLIEDIQDYVRSPTPFFGVYVWRP